MLACTPAAPFLRLAICVVTVTDTAARPSLPTGSVTFTATAGVTFSPPSCTLAGIGSTSVCAVVVSMNTVARTTVTANYAGTATLAASSSSAATISSL